MGRISIPHYLLGDEFLGWRQAGSLITGQPVVYYFSENIDGTGAWSLLRSFTGPDGPVEGATVHPVTGFSWHSPADSPPGLYVAELQWKYILYDDETNPYWESPIQVATANLSFYLESESLGLPGAAGSHENPEPSSALLLGLAGLGLGSLVRRRGRRGTDLGWNDSPRRYGEEEKKT